MPTGYTAYIEDGKITNGKDFLKLCTRAFGIAVELKDQPLSVPTPKHFEPNTYYKNEYDDALQDLEAAKKMTFDEAKAQMRKAHEQTALSNKKYAEQELANNAKYDKVRKEVEEWIPPTEEHERLKAFALEQIDMSKTSQKYIDECLEQAEKFDDSDEAVRKYIDDNIAYCQRAVEYAQKSWQEELERTKERNEWMEQFLNSLN